MTDTNETIAALAAQLAAMQAQGVSQSPQPASGWNQPAPVSAPSAVIGVSVPISLQTPIGKIRVYLAFGAEHAASPQALNSLIEKLSAQGLPLDAWQPQNGGNQSGGWGGNNGGFNGGNNGYRRRY